MDLKFEVISDKYFNIREVLRAEFKISSRLFLKLRSGKKIYLNRKVCTGCETLSLNDIIEVDLNFEEDNSNIVATNMPLDIIYEDNYLLILNKPAGITIHPSMRHFDTSLSNGIKHYFDEIRIT